MLMKRLPLNLSMTVTLLTLVVGLSMACSGAPPTTTESQPPTLEPTRHTPIPTLNPRQKESTRQAQLATVEAGIPPTPRIIYPTVSRPVSTLPLPTPVMLVPTLNIPTQLPLYPTPAPVPMLPPTPPLPVLPTLAPPPTLPLLPTSTPRFVAVTLEPPAAPQVTVVPVREPEWTLDDRTGDGPTAVLLTRRSIEPVRGMMVDCAGRDGDSDPWLALRIVGEGVFPPDLPQYSRVQLAHAIDGGELVTTEWLPHPDWWDEGAGDFQRLYPAKEVGTAIINALLGGAVTIEVSVGDMEYGFNSHGFVQAAATLIDSCQSMATAPPLSSVSVEQFGAMCAEIRDEDESAPGWSFREWVARAQAVDAPPEVADWWNPYVDQFALQTDAGPNADTQAASDRATEALAAMSPELQETLIDVGCLDETDVWLAHETLWAWGRLQDGLGQTAGTTLDEFVQACVNIQTTVPTLDTLDNLIWHLAYWWDRLVPPPVVAQYYSAVADFYEAWMETGDAEEVDLSISLALASSVSSLDTDVFELLEQSGCMG